MRLGSRAAILSVAGLLALYLAAAAYVLRFEASRLLFLPTVGVARRPAPVTLSFKSAAGNELLLRPYGEESGGCVVFFPGQHGSSSGPGQPNYPGAGLAEFVVAYPGQDGAAGSAELSEIEDMVGAAVAAVASRCQAERVVLIGYSLGAMLAAYAARSTHVVGVVLVSAAPSLSSAIGTRLRSSWALAPLRLLPVSKLLAHDYSLAEALAAAPGTRVVVFQGADDVQTPLELLRGSGIFAHGAQLTIVPNGTHSSTYRLTDSAQLDAILNMLQRRSLQPVTRDEIPKNAARR